MCNSVHPCGETNSRIGTARLLPLTQVHSADATLGPGGDARMSQCMWRPIFCQGVIKLSQLFRYGRMFKDDSPTIQGCSHPLVHVYIIGGWIPIHLGKTSWRGQLFRIYLIKTQGLFSPFIWMRTNNGPRVSVIRARLGWSIELLAFNGYLNRNFESVALNCYHMIPL